MSSSAVCIFCKIIKGIVPSPLLELLLLELVASKTAIPDSSQWAQFAKPASITGDIPSFKLYDSEKVFAFLDIGPLSRGHAVSSSSPAPHRCSNAHGVYSSSSEGVHLHASLHVHLSNVSKFMLGVEEAIANNLRFTNSS